MMKTTLILSISILLLFTRQAMGQNEAAVKPGATILNDTLLLNEIVITALRSNIPLREIPASVSVVTPIQLSTLTKGIAPDEALRLVPGVVVNNGTDGSRVHLYIRGQGILSETGFHGIQVILDGIPINDPGGYCPDLYDVNWDVVKDVQVVRGLAASLYGANATGGIVNITTLTGGPKAVNTLFSGSAGSYGYWKVLGHVDGIQDKVNYSASYSHAQGHGYREHQSFMADNFSEKLTWTPSTKVSISEVITYTSYFNQNSEGINLYRYETYGPRAANTDAVPYNEFQDTKRLTDALTGTFTLARNQNIQVMGFARSNYYRETSNNGDDYKPYTNLGGSAQYNIHFGKEKLMNHLSVGADYQTQTIVEHEYAVPPEDQRDSTRVDSYWSRECFDLDQILINQIIRQRSAGAFLIDKLDIGKKLYALLNVRYDYVYNSLTNNIPVPDSVNPNGTRTFNKPTFRIGLAYDISDEFNLYANYGTGFLTPSNDELYNNPAAYGGFNETIEPSTSQGVELGVRGDIGKKFHYEVTGFEIMSNNEFARYSVPGRGNNTAFFKNIGKSNKWGIETFVSYRPIRNISIEAAYSYDHFRYTAPDYTDTTNGIYNISGHWMPNCPANILSAQVSYNFLNHFTVIAGTEWQSKWVIQVDDSIYNQYTIGETYYQPKSIRSSWVDGFNIYSLEFKYNWKLGWLRGELGLYIKNLFDEKYFGFTEPNNYADYNSYQPAPGREFFVNLNLRF
jgi:iron complex outermembrane recepter protein